MKWEIQQDMERPTQHSKGNIFTIAIHNSDA